MSSSSLTQVGPSSSSGDSKRKVLLMGLNGSGKTSMRSIIFANYIARDTQNFEPTYEIDTAQVHFLGNLSLMLCECGGQDIYVESYFTTQKDALFSGVAVLIFVFDVESGATKKETTFFRNCVEALLKRSPDCRIFCLLHKMDLLPEDRAQGIFDKRRIELEKLANPLRVQCFRTSIWDETLYRAWSSIVYSLIPNIATLQDHLGAFRDLCEADEMVLFERATFLVIAYSSSSKQRDVHRFEKISNIVKQFKLSCSKLGSQFSTFEVQNSRFVAYMDVLTSNAYLLMIFTKPTPDAVIITPPAVTANVNAARQYFQPLLE